MPLNLLKKYSELLEIVHMSEHQRKKSLYGVFKRDIEDNDKFLFREKQIRPTKKDGEDPMQLLYHHLTTSEDKDEKGQKTGVRSFEVARSVRLHWIKFHVDELKKENIEVFSYTDRVGNRKDVIRTYIFNSEEEYVLILEPQRSNKDYYLLTAYYLNEPGGKKQIIKKLKNKLDEVH